MTIPLPSFIDTLAEMHPSVKVQIIGTGTTYSDIIYLGGDPLPSEQQLEADRLVLQLSKLKAIRLAEIRARTNELLYIGFQYDGHMYRNTDSARNDFHGMVTFQGMLTWPVAIFPYSGPTPVYFLQLANLNAFMGTLLSHYLNTNSSGLQMEGYIRACTSVAEIDAVIDGR